MEGTSPLASARIRETLTVEEAARLAGIAVDEARWLEEGRLYRFRDAAAAIAATIAYAAAVGAGAEARARAERLARDRGRQPRRRRLVAAGLVTLAVGIALAVVAATHGSRPTAGIAGGGTTVGTAAGAAAASSPVGPAAAAPAAVPSPAPPRATILVDTIDSAGRPAVARALAARLRRLGYRVGRVERTSGPAADRAPDTAVYFEPGGAAVGAALGKLLRLPVRPLPAGKDPRRLVVVIGTRGLGA